MREKKDYCLTNHNIIKKRFTMKLFPRVISAVAALSLWLGAVAAETNPEAVSAMLNRIGGSGTSSRFVTVVDETLTTDGKETFVITSAEGKPCI